MLNRNKGNSQFFAASIISACAMMVTLAVHIAAAEPETDANAIVNDSFHYMRDKASFSVVDMTIHRPGWERVLTIEAWTKGDEDAIFVITAPPKDAGNATLKRGREMWMYNPKVNRVIKVPPSMMSQGWMGSDFSNNDIAKSDTLIKDYDHSLEGVETIDGKKVYAIRSMPRPAAPVIWGMLKLRIREDGVLLEQGFYDEDFELVKEMELLEIEMVDGKLYPKVWVMKKADAEDEYTEVRYEKLEFKDDLPSSLFTLSNLRNPRR